MADLVCPVCDLGTPVDPKTLYMALCADHYGRAQMRMTTRVMTPQAESLVTAVQALRARKEAK